MASLDLRQSDLDLKLPASGPASLRFVTDVDTSGWALWVQPRSLRVADADEALIEFTAAVDGDGVTFSVADTSALTAAGTLILADGETLLISGFCSRSITGATQRNTTVSVVVGEATVDVTVVGGGGGAVDSVNGETGVVVLGAADVGAAADDDARLTDSRPPTGGAGGVLSGTYPNPGFAVDMVEQSELTSALAGKIDASGDATALWLGTESEYAAIGSPSATTVYVVVPDP